MVLDLSEGEKLGKEVVLEIQNIDRVNNDQEYYTDLNSFKFI